MKKKEYIVPGITVVTVKLQELMGFSGGGDKQGDPKVNPEADDSDSNNRSRRRHHYEWDDEEDL